MLEERPLHIPQAIEILAKIGLREVDQGVSSVPQAYIASKAKVFGTTQVKS